MGDKSDGMTLDRVNNDKGYFPDNCRWATWKQQNRNKRGNVFIIVHGISKNIAEWSEINGWPHYVIHSRLRSGWSHEKSVKTPRKIYT